MYPKDIPWNQMLSAHSSEHIFVNVKESIQICKTVWHFVYGVHDAVFSHSPLLLNCSILR